MPCGFPTILVKDTIMHKSNWWFQQNHMIPSPLGITVPLLYLKK